MVKPLQDQPHVTAKMRRILIDWLVEVHFKFNLDSSSLWLSVNMLDRYLVEKVVLRKKFQLVGISCLLIATKVEDSWPLSAEQCVFLTDHFYTAEDVVSMEADVLTTLNYRLCVATGYHFLVRYLSVINACEKLKCLSFYFAERSLQESLHENYKPSHIVSAALFAALKQEMESHSSYYICSDEETIPYWPNILIEETGFDACELIEPAQELLKYCTEVVSSKHGDLIAVKRKYAAVKYLSVCQLDLPYL